MSNKIHFKFRHTILLFDFEHFNYTSFNMFTSHDFEYMLALDFDNFCHLIFHFHSHMISTQHFFKKNQPSGWNSVNTAFFFKNQPPGWSFFSNREPSGLLHFEFFSKMHACVVVLVLFLRGLFSLLLVAFVKTLIQACCCCCFFVLCVFSLLLLFFFFCFCCCCCCSFAFVFAVTITISKFFFFAKLTAAVWTNDINAVFSQNLTLPFATRRRECWIFDQ